MIIETLIGVSLLAHAGTWVWLWLKKGSKAVVKEVKIAEKEVRHVVPAGTYKPEHLQSLPVSTRHVASIPTQSRPRR